MNFYGLLTKLSSSVGWLCLLLLPSINRTNMEIQPFCFVVEISVNFRKFSQFFRGAYKYGIFCCIITTFHLSDKINLSGPKSSFFSSKCKTLSTILNLKCPSKLTINTIFNEFDFRMTTYSFRIVLMISLQFMECKWWMIHKL